DRLLIDYPGDAEVLRIALKGDRPQDLVKIVNAVKESYLSEVVNVERMQRLEQRSKLENSYTKNRKEWEEKAKIYNSRLKQEEIPTTESAQVKKKIAMEQLEDMMRNYHFLKA